jgi:integrase
MGIFQRKDSPFWWYWIEGSSERKSTGVPIGAGAERRDNRLKAAAIYNKIKGDVAQGKHGIHAARPVISFQVYAEWYLAHVVNTRENPTRERSILRQLRRYFEAVPLHRIDREAVQEWRTKRLTEVEPGTMDRELDVLKQMLGAAVPKYLERNPVTGLKRHRETVQSKKRRPRVLTPAEEHRLLKAATDPEERLLVILALDTLIRLSNIKDLKRERDYGGYLHVEKSKNMEPYDVPLSRRARAALDKHLARLPKNEEYIFPKRWGKRGGSISANTVWRIFRDLCVAAKVPVGRKVRGVTFHALRHTGATRMLENKVNPIAVMEIGGWTDIRQLTRYGHTTDQTKREAVNAIAALTSRSRGKKTA